MITTEILAVINLVALIAGAVALWNRTNATVRLLEATIGALDRRLDRIEDRCFSPMCPHRSIEEEHFEHD